MNNTQDPEGSGIDKTPDPGGDAALPVLWHMADRALDREMFAAFARAASPHTLRAFRSDVLAFDDWCRARGVPVVPATPQVVAGFLAERAAAGGVPASLARYKASIAKLHKLCQAPDPCQDELVKLTLAAHRREVGAAQRQARPLRFRGSVKDPLSDTPRGINIRAALAACGDTPPDLRDKAMLSIAYDTGLRASELVAVAVEDLFEALDTEARLLRIPRSKGDQEGEGATAYLSPRSVAALQLWLECARISEGPVFRRVIVRRYAARPAGKVRNTAPLRWNGQWNGPLFVTKAAKAARAEYHIGPKALHPQSVTPIFRRLLTRAFDAGAFGDLDRKSFETQLAGISAHSTRVGINQDFFASGENLAGIMDALRWKSPRMPLHYNRNLAAEYGAAGRLLGKMS